MLERGFPQGVSRFDSEGHPKNFTAGPHEGNKLLVSFFSGSAEAQVAFDSSGGIFDGDIYVTSFGGVNIYASSGEELGSIGGFNFQCGVAVDQATGALYVGDYSYGGIWRLAPTSGTTPVSAANYTVTSIHAQGMNPCQVAADTAGNVYASNWSNGPTKKFQAADFTGAGPTKEGVGVASISSGIYADPETDDIYIDERKQIGRYDSAGNLIQTIGNAENLGTNSRGVAINATTGHIYASTVTGSGRVRVRRSPLRTDRQPGRGARGPRFRNPQLRRLPGHAGRPLRAVQFRPLADRLRQPGPLRALPLRHVVGNPRLPVLRADAPAGPERRQADPLRAQPDRRRARLLHHKGLVRAA